MRSTDCNICESKGIPINETIKIDGNVYCGSCFQTHFADQSELKDRLVVKEMDPTICTSCSKDFGDTELKKISAYPVCDDCETVIKNRAFPTWVKGFFAAIVAIVITGFIWNWKYYEAYNDIQEANENFKNGNLAKASVLMNSASSKVPEVQDLKTLYAYFHGIEYLSEDKSAEALGELNKCKDILPPDYHIDQLIVQAKIGSTFDHKDYQGFLEASKENLALDSGLAISLASVASAYACIYADKGDEGAKNNAFSYLDRAKAIDDTSKEMTGYYNMIEYRIDSKKIIRREEFTRQFPNGWTKN